MKLIEIIASSFGLLKILVGRLSPHNLITDVCPSFFKADELRLRGIEIEGQTMSTEQFQIAAKNHIGFDLVTEVLETEVRDGINIREHAKMLIRNTIEKAEEFPDYYTRVISEVRSDVLQAQSRLSS